MKKQRPDMIGNKFAKGHKPLKHYFKKGEEPFNKLPKGTPSWYFRNKEQWKLSRQAYKLAHPEKVKECQRRAAKKLYDLKRKVVSDFKDRPCLDCGVTYPFYVMDLDHVRGQKLVSIGANLKSISTEVLLKELEKCEVVCANCHRFRTWQNGVLTAET